ncbi:UvrD-helicase domain-containing protein [Saccharopolyspora gloriosae]|uniref:UvrD-helicase domain-containing protein n=1 Tax=Saccharopolyspora gloriosae TaxID=455344 RepID=UPI001FB6030C|nr:UvrD-helicase domain-containing protein [Saccharopolyspora gloriosae]
MGTDHRAERLRRAAERTVARFPELPGWKRQVLTQFLVVSGRGWRTFAHTAFPATPPGRADVLLIGPQGVLAVAVRDSEPELGEAARMLRKAGELFLGARLPAGVVSEAVVRPVVVLPLGQEPSKQSRGHHLTVSEATLGQVLERGDRRLTKRDAESLIAHLTTGDADFTELVPSQESAPETEPGAELFDLADLARDRFDKALEGPFESWLTFLDDSQSAMVRRDYNGPARISGPAGTGKSVVALHRMVRLARNSVGPLLFTTYSRNLPPIAQRSFERLAPEVGDRAEFSTVHRWARRLLRDRGQNIIVDTKACDNAFSHAWSQVGKRSRLEELHSGYLYWRDEIDRVIKGRGITELADYQDVRRTGRGLRVERGSDRELVWRLYQTYERLLADKGVHDFNDLLIAAYDELQRAPLDPPLAGVVVDEVQDITLVGLRLLGSMAGEGRNRLLLVGDGQQQIYPGGWRLSDAGLVISGRGEVLRNNYRNASRILEWAKRFDASNQVDDLDGAAGFSLREAVATLRGGEVIPWKGPKEQQADALLAALRRFGDVEPDDVAVLTFDKGESSRWHKALRGQGFGVRDLDDHLGERDGTVKVGSVFRAKGLEFRVVFVPELPLERGEQERFREARERDERMQLVALTRARDVLWIGFPLREEENDNAAG